MTEKNIQNLKKLAEFLEGPAIENFDITSNQNCALGQVHKVFPEAPKMGATNVRAVKIDKMLFGLGISNLNYLFTLAGPKQMNGNLIAELKFDEYTGSPKDQYLVAANIRKLIKHIHKASNWSEVSKHYTLHI